MKDTFAVLSVSQTLKHAFLLYLSVSQMYGRRFCLKDGNGVECKEIWSQDTGIAYKICKRCVNLYLLLCTLFPTSNYKSLFV